MRKIIRDKLVNEISPDKISLAKNRSEYFYMLTRKLDEEVEELKETSFNDVNEFADVFEVLLTLANTNGISLENINDARKNKLEKRGGFEDGIIFTNV